jgi:hypothetical protein
MKFMDLLDGQIAAASGWKQFAFGFVSALFATYIF